MKGIESSVASGLAPSESNSERHAGIGENIIRYSSAWALLNLLILLFILAVRPHSVLSWSDVFVAAGSFLADFALLVAGIGGLYVSVQAQAAWAQVSTTRDFEIIKLTKELLDDKSIGDAFRTFALFLNEHKHDLARARFNIHFRNQHPDDPENECYIAMSEALIRSLTYIAQIAMRGFIDTDLFLERYAIDIVQAYYCYQNILDFSHDEGYMIVNVQRLAKAAWDWLKRYVPRSLEKNIAVVNGFAPKSELDILMADVQAGLHKAPKPQDLRPNP